MVSLSKAVLFKEGVMLIAVALLALVLLSEAQTPQQPVYDEPVIVYADPVASPVPVTMPKPSQAPAGHAKPRKPNMELRCTPKFGFSTPGNPLTVMATVRVENPGDDLWCPGVEWYVNNTFVSGHESDCKPYDEVVAEEGEQELWSEPPKPFGFYAGEYIIEAKLTKANRTIRVMRCSIQVR